MNKVFLGLMLLLTSNLLAQNEVPSKRELQKILRNTIDAEAKKKITTLSNCWSFDNTDESFFLNDTIKLFNPYGFATCETINWTFYSPKKFIMTKSFRCQEPPIRKLADANDYYRIKLIETELGLILETKSTKVKEQFKVVSVDQVDGDYFVGRVDTIVVITLVRIK